MAVFIDLVFEMINQYIIIAEFYNCLIINFILTLAHGNEK